MPGKFPGYIVNAKEYTHGGHEVDQRSYYGPSLGEILTDATVESFEQSMKGTAIAAR